MLFELNKDSVLEITGLRAGLQENQANHDDFLPVRLDSPLVADTA